jgi:hypothetical protein
MAPPVVAGLRARLREILPLSTYKDTFQRAGFAATIWRHPEPANFYLFVLEPVDPSDLIRGTERGSL